MGKSEFLVLSPLVVIVIGWLTIRSSARVLGVWAWVPWTLVYWAVTGGLVFWGTDFETFRRWMGPPSGSWLWSALPFLLVLPTLSMFVKSWRLLAPMTIWLPWLVFGLVNPVFEEWYWRGLLLDVTGTWSSWITIPATSILFSLNHRFGIGVTSVAERHPVFLASMFVFGVVFGLVYQQTDSLRWPIVAHAMADLFGVSVAVFLNLWVPPTRHDHNAYVS